MFGHDADGKKIKEAFFAMEILPEVPKQNLPDEHTPLVEIDVSPLAEGDPGPPEHEWGVSIYTNNEGEGRGFLLATETTAERALDKALEVVEPMLVKALDRIRAAKGKSAATAARGQRALRKS